MILADGNHNSEKIMAMHNEASLIQNLTLVYHAKFIMLGYTKYWF